MKDYVIYTAIVGDYDEVKQPVVIDDRFDYILFTDGNKGNKREKSIGVWKLRNLGVYHNTDSVKTARFYILKKRLRSRKLRTLSLSTSRLTTTVLLTQRLLITS